MKWKDVPELIKESGRQWYEHRTFELGAALAYYGVFAIAPTLVLAIAIAGLIYGEKAAQGQLTAQLDQVLGPTVAGAISHTLEYAHLSRSGWAATITSIVVLLLGAMGLFSQLQASLNTIWGVEPKPDSGMWEVVRGRVVAFLFVLGAGVLLLAALVASSLVAGLQALVPTSSLPGSLPVWEVFSWLLSFGLLTLVFAAVYKLLPDAIIPWGDLWVGAVITALLFTLGNYLIGLYLGYSATASVYGAAGSLVVVMLWVYYSSQVLLFGAELTRSFANKYGEPLRPAEYARFRSGRNERS